MNILLIEDSKKLQRSISMGLKKNGYSVDVTGDGNEGLWYIRSYDYDAVILDLMLPGLDGISLLEKVRDDGIDVHVLILSAKDTVHDRIMGLNRGADDYLIKPFSFEELLARIESLIRRKYRIKDDTIEISEFSINLKKHTIFYRNNPISLPPREHSLLELLALNRGRVVGRMEIEEKIYDEHVEPMSNVVDSAVSSLRKKLKEISGAPLIETRRGKGYIIE